MEREVFLSWISLIVSRKKQVGRKGNRRWYFDGVVSCVLLRGAKVEPRLHLHIHFSYMWLRKFTIEMLLFDISKNFLIIYDTSVWPVIMPYTVARNYTDKFTENISYHFDRTSSKYHMIQVGLARLSDQAFSWQWQSHSRHYDIS